MSRIIRTATIGDLDAITQAEQESFSPAEAASRKEFEERLQKYAGHFWLMFEDDRLVAFVDGFVTDEPDLTDEMYENADMHNEEGAWQMIFGVSTVPDQRDRGYAGQLIRAAVADAKKQGRKGVVLTCKEPLIGFYEQFGFLNEGISESVHGDAVWYQMRLSF